MIRLARASLAELESILLHAETGGADLERVEYPPGCDPPTGPLRFEVPRRGGLLLRVRPARYETDDFQLAVLFGRGVCMFASIGALHGFATGSLARAFGIAVDEAETEPETETEPAAEPEPAGNEPEPGLVETLRVEARAVRVRRRRLTTEHLAARLGQEIHGQDAALERVASVVVAQLAKKRPSVPGSLMLLGPTGVGKTATIETLPKALASLGQRGASVYRIDCAELAEEIQLTRVLGVAPGYVGHTKSTAFLDALSRKRSIVLLDEIEKAHPDLHDALLAVLDTGRLTAPTGEVFECAHATIALTSNLAVDELEGRLWQTPLRDRVTVQRICREHLVEHGLRSELVGRIGAFAVFGELDADARRGAAERAIHALAAEYDLRLAAIDPIVVDVVLDLAEGSGAGARGLRHAARDLLAGAFAELAGEAGDEAWSIVPGPPPELVPAL